MQVLIVDDVPDRRAAMAAAFRDAGFQTIATASQQVAHTCLRHSIVDLLVMVERVEGRLTHGLALLAEHRAPMVATFLLTARTDPDVDELFLLLPSLHCLLPPDAAPTVITRLALASVSGAAPATWDDGIAEPAPMLLEPSMRIAPALPAFLSTRAAARPQWLARTA